jgi:hypothetical protein
MMEIEFDKEIDAILRNAMKDSQSVELSSAHLDADEISSFAENVLPAKARVRATEHLADCLRCRKILVEISAFTEVETPSEIIHATELKTEIPWYKKLFAFPNLAYSMGAVCLVFAGIIGFTVFQSRNTLDQVASVTEKSSNAKGASSDGIEQMKEVPISNSTVASNTNANTAATDSAAVKPAMNSTAATNSTPSLPQLSPTAPAVIQPNGTPKSSSVDKAKTGGETLANPITEALPPMPTPAADKAKATASAVINPEKAPIVLAEQPRKAESETKLKSDSASDKIKDEEDSVTRSAPRKMSPAPAPGMAKPSKKVAEDNPAENRQLSGKKFRKIGGTWFDSAYGSQPQTNVSRGSADFKKLDGGLQNIGNSLDGTVIVVWKNKAYKIQ